MAAIGVAEVGAKRGDLDFKGFDPDQDYAELCAYIEAVGKEPQDFLRRGVSCNVIIRGLAMKKDVANAATDEEGLVAVAMQRGANRIGEFAGIHGMIMRLGGEVNEAEEVQEVQRVYGGGGVGNV